MRHPFVAFIFMALFAGASLALDAQKKVSKTNEPASAVFRCPGAACPVADPTAVPPVLTDAITGDGVDLAYTPADGATIDTVGEFLLRFEPTGRTAVLDFSNGPAPCSGCRRDFTAMTLGDHNRASIHTNIIDPATGDTASQGIRTIPVGQTWPSRLKIGFDTYRADGTVVAWSVRFNPDGYAPSNYLWVTRLSDKQWQISATSERAMLVSTCCRQRGVTNEGLYVMPFRLVVTELTP